MVSLVPARLLFHLFQLYTYYLNQRVTHSVKKLLIILAFIISAPCLAVSSPEVSAYGKLLTDNIGIVKVEMANLKTKNEYGLHNVLVKVTGLPAFQHGIDGQVKLYQAVPAGGGFNLQYEKNGKLRNLMSSRQLWGSWESMEIFLDGSNYNVYVAPNRSKEVNTLHLASAYANPVKTQKWTYSVNPYGLALSSLPAGLEVEIAYFKKKNKNNLYDVLMKITGEAAYNAGIDGKVMRYHVNHSGSGYAFSYKKDGAERNRMITRSDSWLNGKSYELYFGNKTFKLYPNKNSSTVRPLHLLSEHKKQ